jgi:glucose-6-phosphate isomerase
MIKTRNVELIDTNSFKELKKHFETESKDLLLKSMFQKNSKRFEEMSFQLNEPEILFDFSKNLVNSKTLSILCNLAREMNIEERRKEMFEGFPINYSENRSVMHWALRNQDENLKIKLLNENNEIFQ